DLRLGECFCHSLMSVVVSCVFARRTFDVLRINADAKAAASEKTPENKRFFEGPARPERRPGRTPGLTCRREFRTSGPDGSALHHSLGVPLRDRPEDLRGRHGDYLRSRTAWRA